jgi:membrane protein
VSWALLKKIFREAQEDQLTAEAAKAAYYFFLSFFPSILALFALTGLLGGDTAFKWIMSQLYAALPGDAAAYLSRFVLEVTGRSRPGLLSLALLATVWAASNVFVAIADGLNVMYDLEERRSWWRRRVMALAALLVSLILLSAATAALVAGPELISRFRLASSWHVLRWPMAFAMLTFMMWLIYYLLPNREQGRSWRCTLIGALVGAGLWVLGTLGFRLYVASFASYSRTYGFVGGIMVLLLWLYLTAAAILFGGEVAATLEQEAVGTRDAKMNAGQGGSGVTETPASDLRNTSISDTHHAP